MRYREMESRVKQLLSGGGGGGSFDPQPINDRSLELDLNPAMIDGSIDPPGVIAPIDQTRWNLVRLRVDQRAAPGEFVRCDLIATTPEWSDELDFASAGVGRNGAHASTEITSAVSTLQILVPPGCLYYCVFAGIGADNGLGDAWGYTGRGTWFGGQAQAGYSPGGSLTERPL